MNIREYDLPNINKIGIYIIVNKVNNKSYVGKTGRVEDGFIGRWKEHNYYFNKKKCSNFAIYNAFEKYGLDNFEYSILEIIEPIEDINKLNNILNFWERYYINYYDSYNNGYNMTKGGDGILGYKYTEEQIQNLSVRLKEKFITDIEYHNKIIKNLNKLNENQKGENNRFAGKHHTEETKQKISEKNKGNVSWSKGLTKETDERLRLLGEKVSKINKGKNLGINNPNHRSVVQLSLDGEFIKFYECVKDVEKDGFIPNVVGKCCNNNYYNDNKYKNSRWVYKENYYYNK